MRALVYHTGHDVKVDAVPDPVLQQPDDISHDIMGHEFRGVVVDS